MIVLWAVIGAVGLFIGYHFVQGFVEGLSIRRRPRLRVVRYDEEAE